VVLVAAVASVMTGIVTRLTVRRILHRLSGRMSH
jgi:hypothetical protein